MHNKELLWEFTTSKEYYIKLDKSTVPKFP